MTASGIAYDQIYRELQTPQIGPLIGIRLCWLTILICYNARNHPFPKCRARAQSYHKSMRLAKLFSREEQIENEFHVSIYIIVYRFLLGTIEFLAGITIAFFGARIYQLYQTSLIKELSEDPHDLLARLSEAVVPSALTHNTYIVIYLIVLGLAKMAGAIGLVYKKNWGVDLLVGLTILMAPFQIVNLRQHPGSSTCSILLWGF
jgi:uncharacterized membrane protein